MKNILDICNIADVSWQHHSRIKIKGKHFYKSFVKFNPSAFEITLDIQLKGDQINLERIMNSNEYIKIKTQYVKHSLLTLVFNIPNNFICDSTSLLNLDDKWGDLHDFGYRLQGASLGFTKEFWDKAYYVGMLSDSKFSLQLANFLYFGVRFFGHPAYIKNRMNKYNNLSHSSMLGIHKKLGVSL